MNGCFLEDAFQELGQAPSPGCTGDSAAKAARREERRKARRSKIPSVASSFLDMEKDPDRQHLNPLPEVPAMKGSSQQEKEEEEEPFTRQNWLRKDKSRVPHTDPSSPSYDKDPLDAYVKNEEREHVMVVPIGGQNTAARKSFFGASGPSDHVDSYADYLPDSKDYRLQPDFLQAFEQSGVARAGSMASLPNPHTNPFWKPITPSGAQTSFTEHLVPPHASRSSSYSEETVSELQRKIDILFARLDDLNQGNPEQMTSEILMFISSGIFVIFLMDLLVKKGSKLRF